jgi:hypothetical protein
MEGLQACVGSVAKGLNVLKRKVNYVRFPGNFGIISYQEKRMSPVLVNLYQDDVVLELYPNKEIGVCGLMSPDVLHYLNSEGFKTSVINSGERVKPLNENFLQQNYSKKISKSL